MIQWWSANQIQQPYVSVACSAAVACATLELRTCSSTSEACKRWSCAVWKVLGGPLLYQLSTHPSEILTGYNKHPSLGYILAPTGTSEIQAVWDLHNNLTSIRSKVGKKYAISWFRDRDTYLVKIDPNSKLKYITGVTSVCVCDAHPAATHPEAWRRSTSSRSWKIWVRSWASQAMEPEWCKVEKLWKNHNFKDYGKSGTFGFSHHDSLNIKAMQRTSNDATRRLVRPLLPWWKGMVQKKSGKTESCRVRILYSRHQLWMTGGRW